jgi:preprotein translocase subunit YajC
MAGSSALSLAAVEPFFAALALLAADAKAADPGILQLAMPFLLMGALFFFLFLNPRNREKQFRAMLDGLKANDHVVTIGGVHGVVTNIQREQGRVTLRVDDSTNTKMTFNITAIERVISDEAPTKKSADSKSGNAKSGDTK